MTPSKPLIHRDGQWVPPTPGGPLPRVQRFNEVEVRERGDAFWIGAIAGWGGGATVTMLLYHVGLMIG